MATKTKNKAEELRSEVVTRKAEVRKEIDAIQKDQLGPLEAEMVELLALVPDAEVEAPVDEPQAPEPVAPAARQPKANGNGKKRRSRKGGTRLEQAVEMVTDNPGIGVPEISEKMKIKANYLYRVLGDAEKSGLVRKDGRAYFPVA